MTVVVVDTGGLISAVNEHSPLHRETRKVLDRYREQDARLVVSPFVLAEVDYLLSEREGRPDIALEVLRDVARGGYRLETFGFEDLERAADVIERYSDQNIGLADAANVVIAERHDTMDILTIDERHFRVLRGPGEKPFRLLPMDMDWA
ncbi:type II toxin-antitoxin system toxin ribonuclease C26 [soil metagenome]